MIANCKNKKCGDRIIYNPLLRSAPWLCAGCKRKVWLGMLLCGFTGAAVVTVAWLW